MERKIREWVKERGYRMAIAGRRELGQCAELIAGLRKSSALNKQFSRMEIDWMEREWKQSVADGSVILIAVPRPAHRLDFSVLGETVSAILPPTYLEYTPYSERILKELRSGFGPGVPELVVFKPFLKTLAVMTGLAEYGRNNITYIKEFGSYFQLFGFMTHENLKSDHVAGEPRRLMEACEKCRACLTGCPTGAIAEERFLLHAERCLTFWNENSGDLPALDEFKPRLRCIAGCMECQNSCPANRGKLRIEAAPVSFTAEETELLLSENEDPAGVAFEGIRRKIAGLGMSVSKYTPVFGRNLKFLLAH